MHDIFNRDEKLKTSINKFMKNMSKDHIEDSITILKKIVEHKDYETYINVFKINLNKNSSEPDDIENTILKALEKGD